VLAAQREELQQRCLLAGGDDYELLFTAPPAKREAVLDAGRRANVAVTACGRITAAAGLSIVDALGRPLQHRLQAFDHFDSSGP
jgi:thiamine-monophosphate kinase